MHRLRQVLVNLVGNAIKFTDRGSVALELSPRSNASGELELAFAVHDTGIGISVEDQRDLFEPFHQVDFSNSRRHGGVGLGLTICRRLAEEMGGKLGVESEPGQGSVFSLTIPVTGA